MLVCTLALLVAKYIEVKVRKLGLKAPTGRPLTGAAALDPFVRVKANEVELPGTGLTRVVVTDPPPEKQAVLKAVGLDPDLDSEGV